MHRNPKTFQERTGRASSWVQQGVCRYLPFWHYVLRRKGLLSPLALDHDDHNPLRDEMLGKTNSVGGRWGRPLAHDTKLAPQARGDQQPHPSCHIQNQCPGTNSCIRYSKGTLCSTGLQGARRWPACLASWQHDRDGFSLPRPK